MVVHTLSPCLGEAEAEGSKVPIFLREKVTRRNQRNSLLQVKLDNQLAYSVTREWG